MKRLILLFTILISLNCFGQHRNYPYPNSAHLGGGERTYQDVIDDSAYCWHIAHADYITITDDSVSQWDDVTDNNIDLTQSIDQYRPTFTDDSVYFDTISYMLNSEMNETTVQSAFMVIKKYHETSWGNLIDYGDFTLGTAGPNTEVYIGGVHATTVTLNDNTLALVVIESNGANSLLRVNNNTAGTGDLGTDNLEEIQFGSSIYKNRITFKEHIFFKCILSDSDSTLISNYLNDKYSVY